MKAHVTLLTAGLLSAAFANAQTTNSSTTNSSGTTTNSTNGTTTPTTGTYSTAPSTTNGTYSTTPSSASYSSGTTTTGESLNSTGTTTSGTYSTSGSTTPTTYGTTNTYDTNTKPERTKKDYKNFVFGVYAGLNSTKFAGESADATNGNGDLSGRLGYQAGFFVRGGGRLYGQLGAEYFASSSNYFTAGSGQSAASIQDQINIQYIQIPLYLGYKLVESDRGISAVRLQIGVEYANRINSNSNSFNLNNSEIRSGTFNGLGQLGFDAGPIFLDLTYHYGFSNAINPEISTGFAGSQRRILSASVGFKF
jgi:hypothetical protein